MTISSASHTLQLIGRLMDPERATEAIIDMGPQKTAVLPAVCSEPLPSASPEQQGVPSRRIAAFLQALAEDPALRMHDVLIVRNGTVLCRAVFGPHNPRLPRMTFSACKSITAMAIGLLMDDGLLHPQDKLADLFPKDIGPVSKRLMKDLTLEHVLSMQTGNLFQEAASMTELNWTHCYFSSPALELSRTFQYNSLNTYILSVLITRITGMSLSQFLRQRLFSPMGIHNFYWETSPEGIEKGGWGLYISSEDLAKLGQLVMNRGRWNGRQLISAEFLEQATQVHAIAPEEYGDFNYGWQFWVGREERSFLFSGMLGQNVLGFRDSGITVVAHAGNDEAFQTSNFYRLAGQFFGGSFPDALPKSLLGQQHLQQMLRRLGPSSEQIPREEVFSVFAGRRLVSHDPLCAAAGLLPLMLQAVENDYTKGLRAISLGGTRTAPELIYEELDQLHHLTCGIREPVLQQVHSHGNVFWAAVQARFTHNEELQEVLRIQIDFPETPFSRVLKLTLTKRGYLFTQEETPGQEFIANGLHTMIKAPAERSLLNAVLGSTEQGYLHWRIHRMFSQTIQMVPEF